MHRLYRKLITLIRSWGYWVLDYIYIVFWQLRGLRHGLGLQAQKTINVSSKTPPIIVIPGVYENWYIMQPILSLLRSNDYDVHVVHSLGYNRGTIEEMAERVGDYILQHNLENGIIIAHSKGGLIGKYLMMQKELRIGGMITLNTPFSGSVYARFALIKTVTMFSPVSPVVKQLALNEDVNRRIVSIYSHFDPHIPGGSYLNGAHNIAIPTGGHFRIINNKKVHETILHYLVDFPA